VALGEVSSEERVLCCSDAKGRAFARTPFMPLETSVLLYVRIVIKHILPNVLSHVIVSATLAIPTIALLESYLGFLGFAV
jgi:hypothetical protein